MPFPTSQDVLSDADQLSVELWDTYVPKDLNVMVEHWILLIQLSRTLGEILSSFYQQLGHKPMLSQFEGLESELNKFIIPEPHDTHQSRLAMFSYHHLQLHYQ
jgi:hypothetical protein